MYYAVDMERFLIRLHDKYRQFKAYGQKNSDSLKDKEGKSTKFDNGRKSMHADTTTDRFYDVWEMSKNNALFKEMCIECELPVPKWYYMTANIDPAILDRIHYPVVVKPVEMCEDAYIFICYTEEELLEGYNLALGTSESRKVVVEEYVNGIVFAASVYIENGKAYSHDAHVTAYLDAVQNMIRKVHMSDGKFILNGIRNDEGSFFIGLELREWGKHSA